MKEFIWVYVYEVLGNILAFVVLGLVVVFFFSVFWAILRFIERREAPSKWKAFKKYIGNKTTIITFISLLFLTTLYPSNAQLKRIVGYGLILKGGKEFSQLEGIEKIPQGIIDLSNKLLQDEIKKEK